MRCCDIVLFCLSTHVSDLTEAWCSRTAGNIFRYSNCPLASPYIEITIVCVESMERVSAFFPIILQSEDPQLSRTKPAPELRLSFYLTFVSSWWRSCSLLIRFVTERCTPWLCGGSCRVCLCVHGPLTDWRNHKWVQGATDVWKLDPPESTAETELAVCGRALHWFLCWED